MAKKRLGTFWMLWAFALTAVTYFLGAGPLRAVRAQLGRGFYWGFVFLLSAVSLGLGFSLEGNESALLIWVGASFLTISLLLGLFSEFEESGLSFDLSAAFSILVLSCLSVGAGGILFWLQGRSLFTKTRMFFEQSLKGAQIELPIDQIIFQIPSVIVILWMLAIYTGVLLEGRIRLGTHRPSLLRAELFQFRAPGWAVWVFIASLLPAFGGYGPNWLQVTATNILNISIAVFFFQGIGIIHQVLIFMRVGLFWQILLVVFLILQLFLFVSCLGLADYWLDLRTKLIKWRQNRLETLKRREK